MRRHTHHDHNERGERYRSDKNYTLNKGGIYAQIMKFLHRNPVNLDTNTHTHTHSSDSSGKLQPQIML